jgi:LuxR family transcriptional regulator, quorum-sensing system regulator CviR
MADIDDLGARLRKKLTKTEMSELIELATRTISIRTDAEFIALEPAIKELLDYRFLMCGFGERDQFSRRMRGPYLNISYPEEFVIGYMNDGLVFQDSFVITALQSPGLHYSDDLIDLESWHHTKAYSFSRSFDVKEGYRSVVNNAFAGMASVFFFTASSLPRDERSELILEVLSPYLHEALCRIFNGSRPYAPNPLTAREKEILLWIKAGKSSWAVSMILSISEATVKFHIKNILRKLDASTRAQAVATAMERGYIAIGEAGPATYP